MANEWIAPLNWENAGTEPSDNLKASGFVGGYKPPAAVFNYAFHKEQECIEQLQRAVDAVEKTANGKANASHTHSLDDMNETAAKKIMTADERNKLADIEKGANAYTLPSAGASLGGVKKGGCATIEDGIITAISTATKATQDSAGNKIVDTYATKTELAEIETSLPSVTATSSDGISYTGTVNGISELKTGLTLVFIPSRVSASASPTFNLNGLGDVEIKRRLSNLATAAQSGYANTWLAANRAFVLVYDGSYWIVDGYTKPAAVDLYGTLGVEQGGTGATTAAAALNNLGISSFIGTGSYLGELMQYALNAIAPTGFSVSSIIGGCSISSWGTEGFSNDVLIIPSKIDGVTVVCISEDGMRNVTSRYIILPNTLTTIDYKAFNSNNNIEAIFMPKSVTSIGSLAFTSDSLYDIYYDGTLDEWHDIEFGESWAKLGNPCTVHCSDGIYEF